jgi:hypothetical protein
VLVFFLLLYLVLPYLFYALVLVFYYLFFPFQCVTRSTQARKGIHTYRKENLISSELNEDRDMGRVKSRDRKRRKRLRPGGTARDWPATALTLAVTRRQLGHEGGG